MPVGRLKKILFLVRLNLSQLLAMVSEAIKRGQCDIFEHQDWGIWEIGSSFLSLDSAYLKNYHLFLEVIRHVSYLEREIIGFGSRLRGQDLCTS